MSNRTLDSTTDFREAAGIDADDPLEATTHIRHIGGISLAEVTVPPGVTVLTGQNATNRTSFLTAINAVLGGSMASINSNEELAEVELQIDDGDTFNRRLKREQGTVSMSGEPFLDDSDIIDTFVSLFEMNDVRQAVQRGGEGLRDILMRPLDTGEIKRQIREKTERRDELESRLRAIESKRERAVELEERKSSTQDELEGVNAEIEELKDELEAFEADADMAEEAEELMDELEAKREERRSLRDEKDSLEAKLEALREEESTVESRLEEMSADTDSLEEYQSRLSRLQGRKDELSSTVDGLSRIISFTGEMLDDATELPGVKAEEEVTAELDPSTQLVECWTCGSEVERSAIQSRLSELQDMKREKQSELNDVREQIREVKSKRESIRSKQTEIDELKQRLESTTRSIQKTETEIENLEDDIAATESEISDLEEEVEETEELRESDILSTQSRLNELEYERGRLENELQEITTELAQIEELEEEQEEIEETVDTLREEITDLRERIASREREVVESFNKRMETILDLLEYENIARVWIERKVADQGRGSRSGIETGTFDLHIVRESSDGTAYEDVITNLSESEREVIGLLAAVTGYLVHDIAEEVPFILLDSVEAIDSERLVKLVEHLSDMAIYTFVALLPEDAAAFPDDGYHYVSPDLLSGPAP